MHAFTTNGHAGPWCLLRYHQKQAGSGPHLLDRDAAAGEEVAAHLLKLGTGQGGVNVPESNSQRAKHVMVSLTGQPASHARLDSSSWG
jgi:hypothetical protein